MEKENKIWNKVFQRKEDCKCYFGGFCTKKIQENEYIDLSSSGRYLEDITCNGPCEYFLSGKKEQK